MTKTIFITGATAGIGLAAARRFAREGWRVIATGRRGDRLRKLSDELGDACLPLELDMRDIDALQETARLSPPWGEIDLLLNNAGLAPPMEPLQDSELAAQTNVIDTNVTGLVALTRALLPKLIERKAAVINLSSVAATYPYRGGSVYGATKAILARPALRPRRHRGPGDFGRARIGRDRVHDRANRRRQASIGQALFGH
jgi:serine 3-dehydrogenase